MARTVGPSADRQVLQEHPSVVNQIYQPKTDSGVPKASVHCPGKCQERCAHPSEPELPPQPAVGPSVVAWHARAVAATMGQCVAAVLLCVEERRRIDCMHPAIGRSCRLQSPGDRCGSSCASMCPRPFQDVSENLPGCVPDSSRTCPKPFRDVSQTLPGCVPDSSGTQPTAMAGSSATGEGEGRDFGVAVEAHQECVR